MKRFSIIGLTVVVYMGVMALLWMHLNPSDQQIQRKLAGTWVLPMPPGRTLTFVIAQDGGFVSQFRGLATDGTIRSHGEILVRHGIIELKETVNNKTVILHKQVVRLDSHELVWRSDKGFTDEPYYKLGE